MIDAEINPHCAEWEAAGAYPAHEGQYHNELLLKLINEQNDSSNGKFSVMKKLGSAGFLGTSHPEQYGGLGLDYSYTVAVSGWVKTKST